MTTIPTLASPTFVTGANDALAVADIYNLINPGIISDIESVLSEIASISSALLGSGLLNSDSSTAGTLTPVATNSGATTSGTSTTSSTSSTSSASSGVASGNVQTPVSSSDLLTRLGTASTQLNTALRGLSTNAQTTITNGLNNNASSAQQVTLNGITSTVQSASYSDIAQIATIINSFTGGTAVTTTDTQSFASIISGIVTMCANLGIPNSFNAITSAITDTTILNLAVGMCLDSALVAGDLLSVASMAQKLSSSAVISANPTLIQTYVSNFTTSYYSMLGYDASQANATLDAIVRALDQIDPDWNTTTRNGADILDASNWTGANPAFDQLIVNAAMQAQDDDDIESTGEGLSQSNALAYLFSSVFGNETVFQALEKDYPMVTLTTNEAVALAIDPSNMLAM